MDEILNCSDSDKFDPFSDMSTKKRKLGVDDYIDKENSDENTYKKKYWKRQPRSTKNTEPLEDIEVQCYYCSEMTLRSVVKEHMKTSHGRCDDKMFGKERQFQCPDCYAALLKEVTINHICLSDPPLKKSGTVTSANVQCGQCMKTFYSVKLLEFHMKTSHSDERSFASKWPFSRLDLLESLRQKNIFPGNRQFMENVRALIIEKFKIQSHKWSNDQESELSTFCKQFATSVRSRWFRCRSHYHRMYDRFKVYFDTPVTFKTIKPMKARFKAKKLPSRKSCTRFGYLNKHKKKIRNKIKPFEWTKSSSSR
jgi:hypothetical protein